MTKMKTFTARYSGRLAPGRQPTKQIKAPDADCARKQAAYWFGCIAESDRLTVALAPAKRWPTEAELQAEFAALEAARGKGNS